MKKFNKLFKVGTKVQIEGEYGFRTVRSINDTRIHIKVEGMVGSYQRAHVIKFTNSNNVEMYPALDDLYITDQYDSVFEKRGDRNMHIGKLNGRTLKRFIEDREMCRYEDC